MADDLSLRDIFCTLKSIGSATVGMFLVLYGLSDATNKLADTGQLRFFGVTVVSADFSPRVGHPEGFIFLNRYGITFQTNPHGKRIDPTPEPVAK